MTIEERGEAFIEAQNELSQKFGVVLVAVINPRMLGGTLQAEAQIQIQEVQGWEPDGD